MSTEEIYFVWKSHTCWQCSGGTGVPRWHADKKGPRWTSPCDTVAVRVKAINSRVAIRFAQQGRNFLDKEISWKLKNE